MVFVVDGVYSVTSPLLIGNGTHLQLSPSATLMRNLVGNPTVANVNWNNGGSNTNIRISGGKFDISPVGPPPTGKHLYFRNVTGLTVTGTRFVGALGDWNTAFLDCDDVVISQIVMRSGSAVFEDGLHFAGCRRVSVSDSLIECGDDALSLTNESAANNVHPLEDFVATNLYLYSRRANPVRISIIKAQGSTWTPTPIRRVRLSNIVAKAGDATGGGSVLIRGLLPPESQELITDIEIDGFTFDASQSGAPLNFDNARRIRVSRFVALQPGARAEIDACDDVELNDCVIDSPHTASAQCLLVASSPQTGQSAACNNIRVVGGQYRNATQNAIVLGSTSPTSNAVAGFEVSGALIQGGSSTLNGVLLTNASGGIVRANNILGCNFKGIDEASPSTNNLFIANRVKGNTLGGLALTGTTSDAARNYPSLPGLEADDTGGFRRTIDGWQFLGIDANQGLTEMTRLFGRFRAARNGSVTGITLALKLPSPTTPTGSITARVYKNVNAFGAAGIDTGLFVTIVPANNGRNSATQDQNKNGPSIFAPGDELYIVVQASGWTPSGTDVFAGLEIED